jgi:hypothetical protein
MTGMATHGGESSRATHQSSSGSSTARKTFELNNDVITVDPIDALFAYSREEESVLEDQDPWKKE